MSNTSVILSIRCVRMLCGACVAYVNTSRNELRKHTSWSCFLTGILNLGPCSYM